ncbi:hypothetical protein [Saccharopolyspora oryzae]|uniref:Uncharacterized protein n=1 Tax=Saccharopolyspora oryzae TaxID=2997343 RepID=A0ABT4UXU1_9PSEU|nr:hypothetical protein [Saccharopolyspora oryzae]MDA3626530.1 hypothetical protein [Saccharopolyspora oryzae]
MTPQDRQKFATLATMIRGAILALGYAVDDIEQGRWSPAELRNLAASVDKLGEQLRGSTASGNNRVVVDSVRADR